MSRSDRVSDFAVGGWALVLCFVAAFASEDRQQHQAKQQTAHHQAAEKPPINPEVAFPAVMPAKPASKKHDDEATKREPGQSADNLFWGDTPAQWLMAMTGVAALALSGWAVWLLRGTLRETRMANRYAGTAASAAAAAVRVSQVATERDMRSVLEISDVEVVPNSPKTTVMRLPGREIVEPYPPLKGADTVRFRISIANLGKVPAINILVQCRLQIWSEPIGKRGAKLKVQNFPINYIHPRSATNKDEVVKLDATTEFRSVYYGSGYAEPTCECMCHIVIFFRDEFTMEMGDDVTRKVAARFYGRLRKGSLVKENAYIDLWRDQAE